MSCGSPRFCCTATGTVSQHSSSSPGGYDYASRLAEKKTIAYVARDAMLGGLSSSSAASAAVACRSFSRKYGCDLSGLGKRFSSTDLNRSFEVMNSPIPTIPRWKNYAARRRPGVVRMESTTTTTDTKKRFAKLYVKKMQAIPLPLISDLSGNPQHLSLFLREPEGRKCMLNTKALRRHEEVSKGVYRCYLPKIEFLSFDVAPILDLQVTTDDRECQVDLLSCRFEGSDLISGQNQHFSATLKNQLSWSPLHQEQQYLALHLELNVSLEVYTLPFTVLPLSAVESPGTLILQTLVDKLVPLFLDQLIVDYRTWAEGHTSDVSGGIEEEGKVKRLL